jgi:hypothetical protein
MVQGLAMDEKDIDGRWMVPVVVRRDEKDFKIIDITAGEKRQSVTVARRLVDDDRALWGWDFTVSTALVATGVHAYQWPTWERALEEAIAYITQKLSEAHDS